ncbi:MAG TPA: ABC transporter permease [Blastocatellia bacterium]|nr:ABC transporter permease [Blastocatellia bacterium]
MRQNSFFALIDVMAQDIRYGLRVLRRSVGQSLIIILTLAFGIAANCAIFSVIDGILLRPLPFPDPEQLVVIRGNFNDQQGEIEHLSVPEFADLAAHGRTFSEISAYNWGYANLSGVDEPQRLVGVEVTATFFSTLKSAPILGRAFLTQEEQFGDHRVAIISYDLWQRKFGGAANVLQQTIRLDDETYTIVGVMPAAFNFPFYNISIWRPLALPDEEKSETKRNDRFLYSIARLKPGVNLDQAQAQLNLIADRMMQQHPEAYPKGLKLTTISKHEEAVRSIRPALLLLFAGVALVLLIGCGNIANILLARAVGRQQEIATRIALGASRARLARQLLTENLLTSLIGGTLGVILAKLGVHLFLTFAPPETPYLDQVTVNYRVVGFALALALLTGMFLSLVPTLTYSKPNLNEYLKENAKHTTGGRHRRLAHNTLVISQIALALVLLLSAGLLIKSFRRLQMVPVGFEPTDRLSLRIVLPMKSYPTAEQRRGFFQQLLERVGAVPGVVSVGSVTSLPLADINQQVRFSTENNEELAENRLPRANYLVVSPNYFNVLGISMLKGQTFQSKEVEWLPEVIINETLARRYLANEDPIGKQIKVHGFGRQVRPATVIGVVADLKHQGLDINTKPEIYVSYLNAYTPMYHLGSAFLVVQTKTDVGSLTSAIRREVQALDKDQPIFNIMTMDDRIAKSVFPRRFSMLLLSTSAAVALLLSFVGTFGLMSYLVAQRTPEIAIRLALGASPQDMLKLVVGQALRITLIGISIGLVAAFLSLRLMTNLLFGVKPTDPTVFASTSILLLVVALLASYVPARKAMQVDPLAALRSE